MLECIKIQSSLL